MKEDGEAARELRELLDPFDVNPLFIERPLEEVDMLFDRRVTEGPDRSLSVASELAESSTSPTLPPLFEAETEARLSEDELALRSLSFPFSS